MAWEDPSPEWWKIFMGIFWLKNSPFYPFLVIRDTCTLLTSRDTFCDGAILIGEWLGGALSRNFVKNIPGDLSVRKIFPFAHFRYWWTLARCWDLGILFVTTLRMTWGEPSLEIWWKYSWGSFSKKIFPFAHFRYWWTMGDLGILKELLDLTSWYGAGCGAW